MRIVYRVTAVISVILFSVITSGVLAADQKAPHTVYKIGVLAYKGKEAAVKRWGKHGSYLSQKLAPLKFEIVPLTYTNDELSWGVINREVDFVITNPGHYTELELGGHVSRMATRRMSGPHGVLDNFGGTVISHPSRKDLNRYADLKGKKILIPSQSSLGGWQVHLREAFVQGVDLRNEAEIIELKNHKKVVESIVAGKADAGFIRSDLIEELVAQGVLQFDQVKVINQREEPGYPYLLSTRLYPEWPFAMVSEASSELAVKVLQALLEIQHDDDVAKAAGIDGWTIPGHYSSVGDLFREAGLGPFALQPPTLKSILKEYWQEILLLTIFLMVVLLINTLRTWNANRALRQEMREHEQAEVEKERLQRELIQSHKMEAIGQLAGGVAHDFNNIMGIIQGFSELARGQCVKDKHDKVAGYFDHIQNALNRAISLVSQMLAYSREMPLESTPLFLHKLVKEDLEMLRATLPTSIEIVTEIDESLPRVLMDQTQLHQILINLATNARDAMNGKGLLSIKLGWVKDIDTECSACHTAVNGDWVALTVSDTGSGIDPLIQSSIFNPFFTTKEVGKGTGMGMALIHGIVRSHDGHILMESEPGEGTTFYLIFPPITDDSVDLIEEPEEPAVEELFGKGEHILVVDDEAELGDFVGYLLESHGYRITVLDKSEEALELFREKHNEFDMVVTDQTMPKMTGTELAIVVREINPDIPILICTGYSDYINQEIADEMDVGYLEKPVKARSLIQTVKELLVEAK